MKGELKSVPSKDLIYGVEGVGKSGLASTYPNPIFLDFEGSTYEMDVDRFPIKSYTEFVEAVTEICTNKDFAHYQTVVIDTLDWMENAVVKHILKADGASGVSDHRLYGFGMFAKRIKAFANEEIITQFNRLQRARLNIVMVSHAEAKNITDPIYGESYIYKLKGDKDFMPVFKEWASNMFFINFDTVIEYKKGLEKNKLKGGRTRYIHTIRTPQYEAKCRYKGLPERMLYKEGVNPYLSCIKIFTAKENESELRLRNAIIGISECTDREELEMLNTAYPELELNVEYKASYEIKQEELKHKQEETES